MERVRDLNLNLITVVCLAALTLNCSGGNKQISKKDIQLAAGDLRTFAASAQMLVEQCSAGRATETFCREQADLLADKIEVSLGALNGQGGDAESERKQLEDIGVKCREIILRVERSSSAEGDFAVAGRLSLVAKTLEDALRK